jgi:hypothetical protein
MLIDGYQVVAIGSVFYLHRIDLSMERYPDLIAGIRNPFDPALSSVIAAKTLAYLVVVFSLSALFSASLWLCLKTLTEANYPTRHNSAGDPWYWIMLHCNYFPVSLVSGPNSLLNAGNVSLLLCGACILLQVPLFGWIGRDFFATIVNRILG